ncbi:ankyrin repeat domain-containing protein [Xanthomonas cucurbitae]|uniref:Ankyrin repeat domain-containing protein n=1 Tax=Xanthomonas cucurbitae TaxID=56453 RepID=A0ABY7YDZ3_9XANT|nr:ankyrin repeat domain-containing protein [Xanthomonas cucurbitae]WDM68212.1 ankyrin repeat domain-containing protein [Xanthomonas cucurbitae]WDM72086.1 ankyrin repeat domain-containing protein [Xanthomonas cucurbitae]
MSRLVRILVLSLSLVCASCGGVSLPAPAQQSAYPLRSYFPDPKAQALALAAEHGNVEEVRRLMKEKHVDPDVIFSKDGYPLLMWPILTQNPEGLRAMLENWADPNARKLHPQQNTTRFKGRYEDNAMVWAAKQEDPVYLKLLLDHGGDPNVRNSNGETLLLQAFLTQNKWENVKLLVERGADVNAKSQGAPILFTYAARGGFEQTYWLLEHGADPGEGSPPPLPKSLSIVESIFWHPGNPNDPTWQRKCQQWLLQRGYQRPPLPESFRSMRKAFGFPSEEKDIPLL